MFMPDIALQTFQKKTFLIVSPNQSYFRLIHKALRNVPDMELLWADETIRGLSEIFVQRPKGLIVMFESNQESLAFVQLVRNNAAFKDIPILTIFTEPLKWRHKWRYRRYRIWPLGTPIPVEKLIQKIQDIVAGV